MHRATISAALLFGLAGVIMLFNATWVGLAYGGGQLYTWAGLSLIVGGILHLASRYGMDIGGMPAAILAYLGVTNWGWGLDVLIAPAVVLVIGMFVNGLAHVDQQTSQEPYV